MSGPVDVLAVMRRACTTLNDEGLFNPGDDLCTASTSVAELIEAAKLAKREVETVCRVEGHDLEYGSAVKLGKASSALHTALARVGAAS